MLICLAMGRRYRTPAAAENYGVFPTPGSQSNRQGGNGMMKISHDGGDSWQQFTDGLDIDPAKASAATGPNSYQTLDAGPDFILTGAGNGTVYRRPDWLSGRVSTSVKCLGLSPKRPERRASPTASPAICPALPASAYSYAAVAAACFGSRFLP